MYEFKDQRYFTSVREDLLALIPTKNRDGSILEIGAGSGATLIACKTKILAREVIGIELMALANSGQSDPRIDKMYIGAVENMLDKIPNNHFNVVLCGDVLEHLTDPWTVLQEIKKKLVPDGVVIASVPNVRHFRVLFNLLIRGDFKYESSGVMDQTHLRFFCKKNIRNLFQNVGFKVEQIRPVIGSKSKILPAIFLSIVEEFLAGQYLIVAENSSSPIR